MNAPLDPHDPESLLAHDQFIRGLARTLVLDPNRADDIAQQTWVAALTHRRPSEGLHAWLATVVRNFVHDAWRGDRRRRRREQEAAQPELTATLEQARAREAARRAVGAAVFALDEPYRTTLVLRYLEGLPPRAISKRMQVPVETVRTRCKRALDQLRGKLDSEHGGDRRAWVSLLLPLANPPPLPVAPTAATTLGNIAPGVVIMSTAVKLALTAVVLAGSSLALWELSGAAEAKLPAADAPVRDRIAADAAEPPTRSPATTAANERPAEPARGRTRADAGNPGASGGLIEGTVVDRAGAGIPAIAVFLGSPGRMENWRSEDDFLLRHEQADELAARDGLFNGGWVTHTEAGGRFAFRIPSARADLVLVAWSADRGCAFHQHSADETGPVVLRLPKHPRVFGAVADPAGAPVPRARVSIARKGRATPIAEVQTDDQGRYRSAPLPAAEYTVSAAAEGFESQWKPLSIATEEEPDRAMDIQLTPRLNLAATLVDPSGTPWTGERIKATLGADPKQLTFVLTHQRFERWSDLDADIHPNTMLEFVPQSATVKGSLRLEKGFFSAWQRSDRVALGEGIVSARTDRIVVQFAPPKATGVLDLRVAFDPIPESVPEVVVLLADRSGPAGEGLAPHTELRARDQSFRIPIPDSFAGRTLWVVVRANGFAEHFAPIRFPFEPGPVDLAVVLHAAGCSLRGRVLGDHGQPLARAMVVLAAADGSFFATPKEARKWTDEDGRFAFTGLPDRQVRVCARAEDRGDGSVLVATRSAEPVVLTLPEGRKLSVVWPGSGGVLFRTLAADGQILGSDLVFGTVRYGSKLSVTVAATARTLEAFEPNAFEPCARAAIDSGEIVLQRSGGK